MLNKKIDHGVCLIDVWRAPGDLNDSWDIVPISEDGSFPRNPNAGYGVEARDRDTSEWVFDPVHVTEHYVRWDENGFTKASTTIYANGRIVAQSEG